MFFYYIYIYKIETRTELCIKAQKADNPKIDLHFICKYAGMWDYLHVKNFYIIPSLYSLIILEKGEILWKKANKSKLNFSVLLIHLKIVSFLTIHNYVNERFIWKF